MAEEVGGKEEEEKEGKQLETECLTMEKEMSRKEKRKTLKKMKRKQVRKEIAAKKREEEEERLNDPQEQMKIELMEREEAERAERERKEFEEREKAWVEAMEMRKKKMEEEEEEERRKKALDEEFRRKQAENANDGNEDDEWEYVEEGPAEIIWQGNEIIMKKKKVRVPKKADKLTIKEDADRPTSNPLPPQSEAFGDYKNALTSAQHAVENVAQQVPNFGTEQDKAHCPFHLKTGACRFGQRCSRVHFYPDKACTILIKNMYNGPGLAWEQDEGLEYTDEEVVRCYEEFYDDVHTEFLKFGEIVNFKVCKNGSFHLRGNVYVHYKCLDSAVLAYQSINGRYFAGKQVLCEFVNLTRWKVAICGEYMKSRFKTCSHGTACNFIHCFRNPGGDYEWADSDKPPPKFWVKRMVALFGHSDESIYDRQMSAAETYRYHSRRSRSRDSDSLHHSSSRRKYNEDYIRSDRQRHESDYKVQDKTLGEDVCEDSMNSNYSHDRSRRTHHRDGDGELSDHVGEMDRDEHHRSTRKSSRWQDRDDTLRDEHHHSTRKSSSRYNRNHKNRTSETDSNGGWLDRHEDRDRHHELSSESSKKWRKAGYLDDDEDGDNKSHEVDESQSDKGRNRETNRDRRRKSLRHRSRNRDHDIGTDWLDKDSNGDRHHSKRRKSSRHSSKFPKVYDDHVDGKNRSHGTEYTRQHQNEASDISDDEREPTKRMKTSGVEMSTKISKVDTFNEDSRLDWSRKPSSSNQDRWDSEQCSFAEIYCKSSQKVTSSDSSGRYDGGKKSCDYYSDSHHHDELEHEDCWKSEEVTSKHRKSRRKSGDLDSSGRRSTKFDKENMRE
ncbi:hypothetical protein FNV43_RR17596 [Rhamnella rubrinervis]|uniref:Zinc finger CCCH domain-containing protein 5 n=1 Tax=Rhamnella rubrinervis TaxID=2594499 RepID=A0A8K0E407_9ROSA|nr:hypothetical protein FNV43_RR17596 [Rhamnella rubrinervis]